MQDRPVRIDRTNVLKDAEAALVAARLLREEQQLEDLSTRLTRVLPYRPTDFEVVVDAVIRSIETSTVLLTPAQAALAARWLRGRGPGPGETAEEYIAAADSLATRLEAR